MQDQALARLGAWSLFANAAVALLSGIALFAFFSVGEPFGTISDVGGVLFAVTLLPPAWWLHREEATRPTLRSVALAVGVIGMISLALVQLLFLLGITDTFALSIPFTAVIGVWLILVSTLARADNRWPAALAWLGVVAGGGLVVSVLGLWLGTFHPIVQLAYAVAGIAEIAWAIWLGRLLLAPRRR